MRARMGIAAKRPNRLRRGRIPDRNVEKRCDLEGESSNMAAECSRRRRLNIHQSLGPRSIPVAGGDIRREDLAQSIEDIGSKRKIDGGRILLQIFAAFGARNRHDVLALRQHPGQGQADSASLPDSAANCSHLLDQFKIALKVLALKARTVAPIIVRLKIIGAFDGARQESSAQWTIGDKAMPSLRQAAESPAPARASRASIQSAGR